MTKKIYHRAARVVLAAVMALPLGLSGCSRRAENLDRMEERDPLLRKARERKNQQDPEGAITLYNQALDRKPTLARAHLEVGILYDAHRNDQIRALYHLERYLELRPDTEKRKIVEAMINQTRLRFAASLGAQPSGAIEEIAMLRREVQALRDRLAASGKAPGAPAAAAAPSSGPVKPAPPQPEPAQPELASYVVQPGDTLSRIASKLYNDPNKWQTIYDANRNQLKSPESVRVGQTLLVPR